MRVIIDCKMENIEMAEWGCSHCRNNLCSAREVTIPYEEICIEIEGKVIDLNIVSARLPIEILGKIYRDYFRAIKFRETFSILLMLNRIPYAVRKSEFDRHLAYFMYTPIRRYISNTRLEKGQLISDRVISRERLRACYDVTINRISQEVATRAKRRVLSRNEVYDVLCAPGARGEIDDDDFDQFDY